MVFWGKHPKWPKQGHTPGPSFLDIELVQSDGIEVGKFIRNDLENIQTHIVYISSKQAYAMQLFQIQPFDFLIKPITGLQLKETLSKSLKYHRQETLYFEYQKGGSLFRVPFKDIAYFTSMDKKSCL